MKSFDYSTRGAYFITFCTENRKNILSSIVCSHTIDTVIGWLKYQATKEINKMRGTAKEKVFQRSFYDHIIRNLDDYEEIYKYICENPLRWKFDKLYAKK